MQKFSEILVGPNLISLETHNE